MTTATLILPGLGESASAWSQRMVRLGTRARLDETTTQGYEEALLDALGYATASRSTPAARCCYLADFNESATTACARADPVSLRADREDAHLIPAELLQLDESETQQLTQALNTHFAEDGLVFTVGRKHRWYVSGFVAETLDAAPVNQVAGRPVAKFLPYAEAAAPWRKLASEVQMLLHAHPLNEERVARGLPPINALWFWGAAALPERLHSPRARLYSDAAYAVGLAKLSGVTAFPFAEAAAALRHPAADSRATGDSTQRNSLLVIDIELLESILAQDAARQQRALARIETELLAAAERALWRGQLQELIIDTCDQRRFVLTRGRLCRFWQRPRRPSASTATDLHERLPAADNSEP